MLAHELAHVTQQHGGAPFSMMPKPNGELEIDPGPGLEREADEAAKEALSGEEPLTVNRLGTDVHVQRLPKGKMFDALALFEGQDDAGEFRETQNDRQYAFLLDEIATYAEANSRLAEVDSMREFQELVTDIDVEETDLSENGTEYVDKELPSKSEITQAKENIEACVYPHRVPG
ncbi:hypothetical protein C487_02383 [Natrinema pallidum DSM 3751]|uniref:DUF4157 domain-containing protein n=2 Tax=Natrinema pallidum TaxID=69527 RepID=L9Z6V2_9EURY|nr:hypothetical protein C487_02383 [Natrinema pallidum DSM 3751]